MSPALTAGVWAAGGVGAVVRVVVDGAVTASRSDVGRSRSLPAGVLVVNLLGSFVLGLVTGLVLAHGLPDQVRLLVGTGFCGGFTTFSTATLEALRLIDGGERVAGSAVVVANLLLSLAAAVAGLALTGG